MSNHTAVSKVSAVAAAIVTEAYKECSIDAVKCATVVDCSFLGLFSRSSRSSIQPDGGLSVTAAPAAGGIPTVATFSSTITVAHAS